MSMQGISINNRKETMMSKRVFAMGMCALALGMIACLAGCAKKDGHSAHDHEHDYSVKEVAEAAVEQTLCPVMGNPINKDVFVEYKGKKVYFCCPGCDEKFTADPEKYLDKLPQFK
jgi:YHS domain-containing protein